jgi:hypothetical protein
MRHNGSMSQRHIVIVPPFLSMLLISYWGRPKRSQSRSNVFSQECFSTLGFRTCPPLLIKSRSHLSFSSVPRIFGHSRPARATLRFETDGSGCVCNRGGSS